MKIKLATQSPYKKKLFQRLAITFQSMRSPFDEELFDKSKIKVNELSKKMSFEKANACLEKFPSDLIIGADQVCLLDLKKFSKPREKKNAIETLMQLQGKTHHLMTSYCILYKKAVIERTQIAKMRMRSLSLSEIESYLDLDEPYDCAGSYKLECSGISLFEEIEVEDYNSIVGLPLIHLRKDLESLGVKPFEK